ncbi:hypothetical protein BB559_003077 [Furculomyces boomerangus]|uniref:protein-serine/threonine phosphatase n=2 Tax=Harpellales TaxID=61421 RepID=A0A2T9YP82_9FUNG|nr:hypothetical protein BB559_003077 [Furculomyces boomerangus]PVZ96668.1 hypothetical protein BB558_007412 [Smittium angustum]
MGQTLSDPITIKDTSSGGDEKYIYGASSMQGWRITMEDAHTTLLKIDPESNIAFFAVFDGHGGSNAAIFAGNSLHKSIFKNEHFSKGEYALAIQKGFLSADDELRSMLKQTRDPSGCTAVCTLITPDGTIYCGNAGDSRAIIGSDGDALELSHDHKPSNKLEHKRIIDGGGFVEYGRVNGNLALSRALGDFDFKNSDDLPPESQVVTAFPDVISHKITQEDEFIVIACDGIWDCLSNQQVAHFVREGIASGSTLEAICEDLMDKCLAGESEMGGVGCDNMTVVIVGLLQGKTKEEWVESIKSKHVIEAKPTNIEVQQFIASEELESEISAHLPNSGADIISVDVQSIEVTTEIIEQPISQEQKEQ